MTLASTFRPLPAALAALLALACGPKTADDGDDTSGTTTAPSTDTTNDTSSDDSTTLTPECTPGDSKPSVEGDCGTCFCSDAGQWQCNRCDPTTSVSDTTTLDTATDDTATDTATDDTATDTATTAPDTTDTGETTGGDSFLPACAEPSPEEDLELLAAQIVGDELLLDVAYGGGCETHDLSLCLDIFDLGGPSSLGITHDDHGDACEALIMETRKLDLTPLQQAGPSPFEFSLVGLPGNLVYEF